MIGAVLPNIVISASQQVDNICKMGDTEHDHCQRIAESLYKFLEGYNKDINVCYIGVIGGKSSYYLSRIVKLSNAFVEKGGTSFHLDIHSDAGGGKGCTGIYTSKKGKLFMTDIVDSLSEISPWKSRGLVEKDNLWVLNQTIATAGLIEVAFHDDLEQAKWIHNNIDNIAKALGLGILKHLGIKVNNSDVNISAIDEVNRTYKALGDAISKIKP